MNCIVAEFVMTQDVSRDDLLWLLEETPAHVIFVLFETEYDEVHPPLPVEALSRTIKDAVAFQNRFAFCWTFGGGVLTHPDRLKEPKLLTSVQESDSSMQVFSLDFKQNYFNRAITMNVAIAYGTARAVARGEFCGSAFAAVAAAEIAKRDVRFLAGVFGPSTKLRELCVATKRGSMVALFQS